MESGRNTQWNDRPAHGGRLRHRRVIGAAALAMGALGMFAAGCGSQESKQVAADTPEATVVAVPAYETSGQLHAARVSAVAQAPGDESQATARVGEGAMPPDIIVTASNTIVAPGEVIDIAVQATPDVTEMSLWDGLNDRQALVYDTDAKAWRVSYRVPLKLPWERTGLAITAKNDAQRWCRAWVFIQMEPSAPLADTAGVGAQTLAKDVVEPGEQ